MKPTPGGTLSLNDESDIHSLENLLEVRPIQEEGLEPVRPKPEPLTEITVSLAVGKFRKDADLTEGEKNETTDLFVVDISRFNVTEIP